MIEFNFNVDGEAQLRRWLDIAADSVDDFSTIFELLAEDFRKTQTEVFKREGANEGLSRWKQLSPGYKKWKDAHYPGKPILTLTGKMKHSLIRRSATDHIERISPNTLEIGTKDFKAILHQRGTRKLPKRKVIDLSDAQKRRWTQIAHRELYNLMSPDERQAHQQGSSPGRR